MEPKTKQYLIVSAVSVTLFAALMNLSAVLAFVGRFIDLIAPVIAGGICLLCTSRRDRALYILSRIWLSI